MRSSSSTSTATRMSKFSPPPDPPNNPPVRYLAIDLGDRRTGLAIGDDETRIATPVALIDTPLAAHDGRELLDRILDAVLKHLGPPDSPGEIVVGLPLNMDGSEGPRARAVRAFAQRIRECTSRPVHLYDERLSSADADWTLARTGLSHAQKKRRRDALAAAAILRDFLGSKAQ